MVSWGKELNCPSDRNQGAWIASAFFADSLMQAMLGVEGAVINISNLLLIAPAGHLDAANFYAAPAKRPLPKKTPVAAGGNPAAPEMRPQDNPKTPFDPKPPADPKPPPKGAAVAADAKQAAPKKRAPAKPPASKRAAAPRKPPAPKKPPVPKKSAAPKLIPAACKLIGGVGAPMPAGPATAPLLPAYGYPARVPCYDHAVVPITTPDSKTRVSNLSPSS